jgi:hypothetical protein
MKKIERVSILLGWLQNHPDIVDSAGAVEGQLRAIHVAHDLNKWIEDMDVLDRETVMQVFINGSEDETINMYHMVRNTTRLQEGKLDRMLEKVTTDEISSASFSREDRIEHGTQYVRGLLTITYKGERIQYLESMNLVTVDLVKEVIRDWKTRNRNK